MTDDQALTLLFLRLPAAFLLADVPLLLAVSESDTAAAARPAASAETAATSDSRSCAGSDRDLTIAATFGDGRLGIARLRIYCSAHARERLYRPAGDLLGV